MNVKLFVIALAVLFCAKLNTLNATNSYIQQSMPTLLEAKGGIRTIVMGFTSIEVHQETATPLLITIYNATGNVVVEQQSAALSVEISTQDWENGFYTIHTQAIGESEGQHLEVYLP